MLNKLSRCSAARSSLSWWRRSFINRGIRTGLSESLNPPSCEEIAKRILPYQRDFYIDGAWIRPRAARADHRRLMSVIDPSTTQSVATISLGEKADTDSAVAAAKAARVSWSETPMKDRQQYIEKLLKIYRSRRKEMAQLISMEMGAPIDFSYNAQVGSGSYVIRNFLKSIPHFSQETITPGVNATEARTTILYDPIGVVALITPWNWPMNQVCLKVIPALLTGCTCILKPSEIAPLSSMLFAEMIHETGIPPGVFNLLNGEGSVVGKQLCEHRDVDMVSFTGSARAGALVSTNSANTFKRVSLELGGKGANIIFDDVKDLQKTIEDAVLHCFENSGQSCNAPTRLLVQQSIYEEAVDIAVHVAQTDEKCAVKSAHRKGNHLGPVASQNQFEKIQSYIEIGIQEEGSRLVAGGTDMLERTVMDDGSGSGYFVKPTIFADVTSQMTIAREEIFGPVLSIMPFVTEKEAIEIANDTQYGLTNYVHTEDPLRRRRLARALRSGMVEMNGIHQDGPAPFGGMKASGNGREGGVFGLEEFCEIKAVTGLL